MSQFSEVLEELLDVFNELKKEGKVQYLASFPMTHRYAKEVVKCGEFDALAGYYNPIETELAPLFPMLEQPGMAFIAIRPLLAGLLTDKRAHRELLAEGDPFTQSNWDDAYGLFMKVKETLKDLDVSWEDFAIKFCLADPRISTVVMGLNHPDQVDLAVKAANGDYPELKTVQQVIDVVAKNRKKRST